MMKNKAIQVITLVVVVVGGLYLGGGLLAEQQEATALLSGSALHPLNLRVNKETSVVGVPVGDEVRITWGGVGNCTASGSTAPGPTSGSWSGRVTGTAGSLGAREKVVGIMGETVQNGANFHLSCFRSGKTTRDTVTVYQLLRKNPPFAELTANGVRQIVTSSKAIKVTLTWDAHDIENGVRKSGLPGAHPCRLYKGPILSGTPTGGHEFDPTKVFLGFVPQQGTLDVGNVSANTAFHIICNGIVPDSQGATSIIKAVDEVLVWVKQKSAPTPTPTTPSQPPVATTTSGSVAKPQCSDAKDNDGDGKIDYPADLGCVSVADTSESPNPSTPPPPPPPTPTPDYR